MLFSGGWVGRVSWAVRLPYSSRYIRGARGAPGGLPDKAGAHIVRLATSSADEAAPPVTERSCAWKRAERRLYAAPLPHATTHTALQPRCAWHFAAARFGVRRAQIGRLHVNTNEITRFDQLGLSEKVLTAVAEMGYEEPSPVQRGAIPAVLEGRDVMAAAQTGTGKTAAFLLPTLDRLAHAAKGQGVLMLVVTPTRELAQQIEACARVICKQTGHRCAVVVGGVGYEPQKAALARGCDVLIATPGRLIDLIDQGAANLSDVSVLVLDEADRMLDMGFAPAMRRIVAKTPATRQTLLFSATLGDDVLSTTKELVKDPIRVEIAHKGTAAQTIDQYVLGVAEKEKVRILIDVLKREGSKRVIVFCRGKYRADMVCRKLNKAGITAAAIHGNRTQGQRETALRRFANGEADVLVATDVLARGIDIAEVSYVVNLDVPSDAEDYIHRIGRTGRAGQFGWALTFVAEAEYFDLRDIEALMGKLVPDFPRAEGIDRGANAFVPDPDRKPTDKLPSKKARKKMLEQKAAAEAAGEAGRSVQSGVSQAGEARGGGRGHAKQAGKAGEGRAKRDNEAGENRANGAAGEVRTGREDQAGEARTAGRGRSRGRAKQVGQAAEGCSEGETQMTRELQGAGGRSRTRGSRAASDGRGRASGGGLAANGRGDASRGRTGEGGASGNRGRQQRTAEPMRADRSIDERPASGRSRAGEGGASNGGQRPTASGNRSRRSSSARAATGQVRNAAAPKAASADPGAKPRRRPGDHGGYKRGL